MIRPLFSIFVVAAFIGCDLGNTDAATGRFTAQIEGGPIETAAGAAQFLLRDGDGPARLRAVYLTDESNVRHKFIVHDGRADIDDAGVYAVDWGPPEGVARVEYGIDTGTVLFGTDVKSGTLTITHFDRGRVQGAFAGTLDLRPIEGDSAVSVTAEFDALPFSAP